MEIPLSWMMGEIGCSGRNISKALYNTTSTLKDFAAYLDVRLVATNSAVFYNRGTDGRV
jgi:hypothetical protein